MMPFFSTGTGLERTGSLGWTEEAGGQDRRMPNCYDGTGPLLVDLPAPTGTPLCKNKEEGGVGEGLARGRSDAKVRLFFEREERDAE